MSLNVFLEKIKNNEFVSFDETIAAITENYHYQPTEFSNGLDEDKLVNQAGTNEGSCKIFAFANIHGLDKQQTLNLFGDYYRQDVLNNPDGTSHQNIRNFMQYGWEGIRFNGEALVEISSAPSNQY
ncbi:MAG: HopJ type III effector protein [Methylococcaceae bacterium]